jgi:hypothetical protein
MGMRPFPSDIQVNTGRETNINLGSGGQGRNRTTDTRIFNPLLYQLSYLAKNVIVSLASASFEAAHKKSPQTEAFFF